MPSQYYVLIAFTNATSSLPLVTLEMCGPRLRVLTVRKLVLAGAYSYECMYDPLGMIEEKAPRSSSRIRVEVWYVLTVSNRRNAGRRVRHCDHARRIIKILFASSGAIVEGRTYSIYYSNVNTEHWIESIVRRMNTLFHTVIQLQ